MYDFFHRKKGLGELDFLLRVFFGGGGLVIQELLGYFSGGGVEATDRRRGRGAWPVLGRRRRRSR